MRCISIHPVRVGRSDGEDRAMTGDSGTLRPNLRRFKSKVLLDSARRGARVVQQAGSVVLRIDDLSMAAVVHGGWELLPFVRRIRALQTLFWQPRNYRDPKRMLSKALWLLVMLLCVV
jgi:hypothetical protein